MAEDLFGIVGTTQAAMFRVERVVAEGGFAVVYRAQHAGFRAPVALKCLKVPEAMTEEQREAFLEKFREEGELLFRLSARVPAIVRPLHVDVLVLEKGRIVPFLALEWLEGETLDQIVKGRRAQGKPPIDVRKLVPFLQPAAHALAQAHRLPGPDGPIAVIHRDLKPENFFVVRAQGAGGGEEIKILDFGIARTKSAAALDAGAMTSGSALNAFTPGYAAPEQWLPRRYGQVGPWTDVFGLALTMVEVLTGKPPMAGDLGVIAEKTTNVTRRPTPRNEGATVSDEVESAFTRALAVDPRERTQSIEVFWTALESALGMPPSLQTAAARAPMRSLTGGSEPPPPELSRVPAAALPVAPTQQAPQSSASGVRRPEEDPPALSRLPESPAIPFELAPSAAARNDFGAPRPRPRSTLAAPPQRGQREIADLRERLRMPVGLVLLALSMSAADWMYTRFTGDILLLGTVRPAWIAAPLALLGVGLACWRFLAAL
jgi:eukaryotic-like serine/threonine-protein kinase